MSEFVDVDINQLRCDVEALLQSLLEAGFIITGESEDECRENSCRSFQHEVGNKSIGVNATNNSTITTQTFFEKRFGDNPFPVSVHIEIVSKCNERCVHCYIPHEFKNQVMAPAMFFDLIKQCQNLKIQHVTISGGEPMLHPQFMEFLRSCRECDMSVNVLSNLTLIDDDIIEEMKRNPLLGVQTSIYSMRPEIHDAITNSKGSLSKTMNGVIRLVKQGIPIMCKYLYIVSGLFAIFAL